ncbi:hypothetical protein [Sphingomonas sp. UYP23]
MTVLCLLLGHAPALTLLRNQRFIFSHCLRCRHDMIRSDGDGASADPVRGWRRVPTGMRVRRAAAQHAALSPQSPRAGMPYLLQIGAIALFWKAQDALRARPKRPRILRLTAKEAISRP